MSMNFGTGGVEDGPIETEPRRPRRGVDKVRVARIAAACVSIVAIAAAGVTIAAGASSHEAAMAEYSSRISEARSTLDSLGGESGPSSADVERVYAAMVADAEPITAFEQTGENFDAALAASDGSLSAARLSDAEGVTVEFSPSYVYENGVYACAWFAWGPDGSLYAYATGTYDEASGLFSVQDTGMTHDGIVAQPVDTEPADDGSEDEQSSEGTYDPSELDAGQSPVTREDPDKEANDAQ